MSNEPSRTPAGALPAFTSSAKIADLLAPSPRTIDAFSPALVRKKIEESRFAAQLIKRHKLYSALNRGKNYLEELADRKLDSGSFKEAIVLHLVHGFNHTQLVQALGVSEPIVRSRIHHGLTQLCKDISVAGQLETKFIAELKNFRFFLSFYPWRLWYKAWQARPCSEPIVPPLYAIPAASLADLGCFTKRVTRILERRMSERVGAVCEVALRPYRNGTMLGLDASCDFCLGEGVVHSIPLGKFVTALFDDSSVNAGAYLLKEKKPFNPGGILARTSGTIGEFTRLMFGSGPVDFDLASEPRRIIQIEETKFAFVDVFPRTIGERPARLLVSQDLLAQGYRFISFVIPCAAGKHCAHAHSFEGAKIWVRAHKPRGNGNGIASSAGGVIEPDSGHLVGRLIIKTLSAEKVDFKFEEGTLKI